ncbi:GntR family transcriptional regulator [Sphingomonas sp. PAMC 26621]|uniref:GntR family transcriptional regulator n=1 Tax=Sphingomonas sp. PAMC 26621 TaxID=1112213 RepID=UPI0002882246|nr:GntR family transcriptional regulator [Sphingomonas sp. PAMC 26621]
MLKPQTTPTLIADALRDDISRGVLQPGAALRQEALAARFAVSRIPIRDALQKLESEGIVTLVPNRGAYVATLTIVEVQEIFYLRQLVEVDLIGQAVPLLDATALKTIRESAKLAEQLSSKPDWLMGDRAFHQALYLPANRPRQLELAMSLRSEVERYEAIYRKLPENRLDWTREHGGLLDACARGDVTAARAQLSAHLDHAAAFLIEQIVEQDPLQSRAGG